MIPPASEIAIRSSIVTGYIENATAAAPESTARSSAFGSAGAAHEIDPLVGPDVADAEHLLEHVALQQRHVETARAGVVFGRGAREIDDIPAASQVHRHLALAARRRGAVGHAEALAQRGEERLRRSPGQILDRSVVGQDLHLVVREGDRDERLGLGDAAADLRLQRRARPRRARRAMMTVGDVERGDAAQRPPRPRASRPPRPATPCAARRRHVVKS